MTNEQFEKAGEIKERIEKINNEIRLLELNENIATPMKLPRPIRKLRLIEYQNELEQLKNL